MIRLYNLLVYSARKISQKMDQLAHNKQTESQSQNLLEGLTSIRQNNYEINDESISINDESLLLESIKNNILTQSQKESQNNLVQGQRNFSQEHFTNVIRNIQMDNYHDIMVIEEKPEENVTEVNQSNKGKSPTKTEQISNTEYELLMNRLIDQNLLDQELTFSQFNNIIQSEKIKNQQNDYPNVKVEMNQEVPPTPVEIQMVLENNNLQKMQMEQVHEQNQPEQTYEHVVVDQTSNTQYLLNKCQEIYDQLQFRNPDILLQRIPETQEENSPPHYHPNSHHQANQAQSVHQNAQIKNNADTTSNFSLDSSALINLIPLDSLKNSKTTTVIGNDNLDENNSKNRLFRIFNEKQHNYIRQIVINNQDPSQHIEELNGQNINNSEGQKKKEEIQTFYAKYNTSLEEHICSLRPNYYEQGQDFSSQKLNHHQNIKMEIESKNYYHQNESLSHHNQDYKNESEPKDTHHHNENINQPMEIEFIPNNQCYKNTTEGYISELQKIVMQIEGIEHRICNDQRDQPNIFNDYFHQNNTPLNIDNNTSSFHQQNVVYNQLHLEDQTNFEEEKDNGPNTNNEVNFVQVLGQQERQIEMFQNNNCENDQRDLYTYNPHQQIKKLYQQIENHRTSTPTKSNIQMTQQPQHQHPTNFKHQDNPQPQPQPHNNNPHQNLIQQPIIQITFAAQNQSQSQTILKTQDKSFHFNTTNQYNNPQLPQNMINLSLNVEHDNNFVQNINDFNKHDISMKNTSYKKQFYQINNQEQCQNSHNLNLNNNDDGSGCNDGVLVLDIGSNKKIQDVYYEVYENMQIQNTDKKTSPFRELFKLQKQNINDHQNNQNQISFINILEQLPTNLNLSQQNNLILIQQKQFIQIKDNSHNDNHDQPNHQINHHRSYFTIEQFDNLRKDVHDQIESFQKIVYQQKAEVLQLKGQRQRKKLKLASYNIYSINDIIHSSSSCHLKRYNDQFYHQNQFINGNPHHHPYPYPHLQQQQIQQNITSSTQSIHPHHNNFNQQLEPSYVPNININNHYGKESNINYETENNLMNLSRAELLQSEKNKIDNEKLTIQDNPCIRINLKNNQIYLDIFNPNNLNSNNNHNHKTSKPITNHPLPENTSFNQSKQQIQIIDPPVQQKQKQQQKGQQIKKMTMNMNDKEIIISNWSTDDEQNLQLQLPPPLPLHQNTLPKQKIINNSIIQSSYQSKQFNSSSTSINPIDNYQNIIKQSQLFLLHKQDQNYQNIIQQYQKLLNKHVYLRFTPSPKTTLGQQLFKNGLFLVAMISLITRPKLSSSYKAYTVYHVFMHVHNFYGQFIEDHKYIYHVELQNVRSRYEKYLNQSYQQMFQNHRNPYLQPQHPHHPHQMQSNNNNLNTVVQTIKRRPISEMQELPYLNIKSIDKISNQQQTTPKKNYMRHQFNLIDQKIISHQEKVNIEPQSPPSQAQKQKIKNLPHYKNKVELEEKTLTTVQKLEKRRQNYSFKDILNQSNRQRSARLQNPAVTTPATTAVEQKRTQPQPPPPHQPNQKKHSSTQPTKNNIATTQKKNQDPKPQQKRQNNNFTIYNSAINHKVVQKKPEEKTINNDKKIFKIEQTPVKKINNSTIDTIASLSEKLKKYQKKSEPMVQKVTLPQSNPIVHYEQPSNFTQNALLNNTNTLPLPLTQNLPPQTMIQSTSDPTNNQRFTDLFEKYRKIRQNRKSNLVTHKTQNELIKEQPQDNKSDEKNDLNNNNNDNRKINKKLKHVQFVDLEQNNSQTDQGNGNSNGNGNGIGNGNDNGNDNGNGNGIGNGNDKKKKRESVLKGRKRKDKKDNDSQDNSTDEQYGLKKQIRKKSKK